jgi:CubicO group peptidase (beta-lactamase class C family)
MGDFAYSADARRIQGRLDTHRLADALMHVIMALTAVLYASIAAASDAPSTNAPKGADLFAAIDPLFADFALDSHIPGLVYGVVANGKLAYVRGIGVQDLESKRPVTAQTLFRIASMTKAFTALTVLTLRDEGKIRLDAPAETYVPELRGWKYPTQDSPPIRVRDLLNHTAGFVSDDPWGDRQTPMPEPEFSRLLRDGVPFARAPQTAMEYSNMGFALLGRIITNVSGAPYADTIARKLLRPLDMTASGFFVDAAPREQRALGYRWEDDAWRLEPTLTHGAFGAMGGLQTNAVDYAKWVAFLLSAWPPRDDSDSGPTKRATVRELAQGSNFPRLRQRPGHTGAQACKQAATYAMGRLRAGFHVEPQRRLSGIRVAPVATARLRSWHIRFRQQDLRRTRGAGMGCGGCLAEGGVFHGACRPCRCGSCQRLSGRWHPVSSGRCHGCGRCLGDERSARSGCGRVGARSCRFEEKGR